MMCDRLNCLALPHSRVALARSTAVTNVAPDFYCNRQARPIDLAFEGCAGGVATASAVRPAQRDWVMLPKFAVGFGLPHYP